MLKGQLSIKRKHIKKQHESPCIDCPFARKAIQGWLGPLTKEEWVQSLHSDEQINCHTTDKQCAGSAIYRANVCKVSRDEEVLQLKSDRIKVFSSPMEFLAHHAKDADIGELEIEE